MPCQLADYAFQPLIAQAGQKSNGEVLELNPGAFALQLDILIARARLVGPDTAKLL